MVQGPAPVAVTGIGVVSPIGLGRQQFWSALIEGRLGIAPIESFPVPEGGPTLGAEVRGFAAREFIASSHLRRMDKLSRMVVAAARMALDDARVVLGEIQPETVGVVIGSALGDLSESAVHLERVFTKGPASASPMLFPNLVLNAAASYVAMEFGLTGVNLTVAQGETSGEQAFILGCELVRTGRADLVLAGGGDEMAGIVFDVYRRARALSSQRGGPEWSSPYDAGRNGIVLGEGAAIVALESPARACARGATILAEVEGYAVFGVPSPPYDWPTEARAALAPLRRLLGADGVELVCGSGNSSRHLDACEIDLCGRLFEPGSGACLTSIKGAVGEFGAAGALSAAATCLALHEQIVPPLCHLREPDAGPSLRFAASLGEAQPINRALLCGLARGGAGAALLFRKN
ncbi:MAG: beta-ketoacyl synthase N-terminal-like domain-containing protein [Candidatus Binatia bacterium]|jgi:3-oxoacyl-[acyl-carrier-protein] synthase II